MRHVAFAAGRASVILFMSLLFAAPPVGAEYSSHPEQVSSSGSTPWMDADACDPDLQPFRVDVMGSQVTSDGALGVAVSDEYAFVADGLSGLQVMYIGEPTSPVLIAGYDTPGYAEGVAVAGGYAFVADGAGGIQILDVSSPASPSYVGSCDTGGFAYDVAVSGNYAFVGGGAGGLQVIDVSNPQLPSLIGTHDVCSTAWGVAVKGNYAYVAGGASGLQIVDIRNPTYPVLIGCYETRNIALGVAVNGSFAYVAGGASGLQVVSINDPTSLMLVAKSLSPDFAYGVAVRNNYAYVAGGANGLQVMQALATISLDGPASGPPTGLSDPVGESGGPGKDRLDAGSLLQNSPNPFISATRIAFSVEREGPFKLQVFDVKGRLVRELVNEIRGPNSYVEQWDGRDDSGRQLPAGTYFYRLESSGWTDVKKMLLVQ